MIDLLIGWLFFILLFALLAWGLWWICTHFFQNFPPAFWICGVILIVVLLAAISGKLPLLPLPGRH